MTKENQQKPLISIKENQSIKGEFQVAPDKSMSHRSIIFASLGFGKSKIKNLLEGDDVIATKKAMEQMGVEITKTGKGEYEVNGVGYCGLSQSDDVLNMGNSGTSSRLVAGLVSSFDFLSFFTGDISHRKRPMKRIFEPLSQNGCKITARDDNFMPFVIEGSKNPLPIEYKMPIASAQVKSSILLSALNIRGKSVIFEPKKCRDHTEIMMKYLGLKINVKPYEQGNIIEFSGMQEFDAKDFEVFGDISSAAFFIVAALVLENSEILIKNVGLNPLRNGIIKTLQEMGGNIELLNQRQVNGEIVADIKASSSKLKGIDIPAERAPSMIDEYPILSIAAAKAEGITKMNGLEELKVKESNRLLMIAQNLTNCGVEVKMNDDSLEIKGGISQPKNLVEVVTSHDHRIAMSFLIMGMLLENGLKIDDSNMIKTSFPNFIEIFKNMNCHFKDFLK